MGGPGGPRRPPRRAAVPGDHRDARCRGAPRDGPRRRAAQPPARARAPRPPAAGAARDARAQLRPDRRAARHRLAPARPPAGRGARRLRPAAPPPRQPGRLGARRRPAGADHHAPQRPVRGPGAGRGAGAGQGHRARRVGQRADAVRRAARRRGARQRLARGAGGGRRGGGEDPRRALGARRGQRHAAARDARGARPVRLLGGEGPARRRARRHPAGGGRPPGDRAALGAPPGADRSRRADRRPAGRRLHGARGHGPEHGRQDRDPPHPRPAVPHAPGRAPHPGGRRVAAAGPARRVRGHRRRAVDRAVAVHVLGSPAVDHPDRGARGPGDAHPARRAGSRHRSDRGLRARPGPARPLHPIGRARGRDDALRRAQGVRARDRLGAQRLRRVRPRLPVADLPAHDRAARAAARPSRSPSASASPTRSSPTRAAG